jgi:hypothetical protein
LRLPTETASVRGVVSGASKKLTSAASHDQYQVPSDPALGQHSLPVRFRGQDHHSRYTVKAFVAPFSSERLIPNEHPEPRMNSDSRRRNSVDDIDPKIAQGSRKRVLGLKQIWLFDEIIVA